ncbi:glycosyltransferase family 9 protein [Noviherbaspirillum sp.]|uniref:glycosyltransferase family 9 protein n=1 Tax=Noviherbaspirillum sp. TaxID=1926288 RepID=UPI002D365959|nr:glycosyltransferase family 9 protein [Noviherbaspirillum sp.]HZW21138.1 glycosyltransferase family 9 protein [Noviherbaspirillum sp.]
MTGEDKRPEERVALADIDQQELQGVPLLARMKIERLVVFRALQVGDMLCAVPALRALRATLPKARITLAGLPWAAQFASRYRNYIDDFAVFPGHPAFPEQPAREAELEAFYEDMRSRQFDLALQLHGSGQVSNRIVGEFGAKTVAGSVAPGSALADQVSFMEYPEEGAEPLRLLNLVEFLGATAVGAHLEFPLTDEDERELQDSGLAAGLEPGSYICIHPGARIRDKCWPPARFAEVADALADEFGVKVVLTGSAKEADLTAAVAEHMRNPARDTASPLSIGAMAALMSRARLLVCNDTGVSHIAAGLRLPSVVVFSKADMQRWAPLDQERHRCIWDPEGQRVALALQHARSLMKEG